MSDNWAADISQMHHRFGVTKWVANASTEELQKYLNFRVRFIEEELLELKDAVTLKDPEEIVDACIDICVVALGTLDAFEVNPITAWNKVFWANMLKEPGVKPERPNPLGLPDLMKPEGWKAPDHTGNHGILDTL